MGFNEVIVLIKDFNINATNGKGKTKLHTLLEKCNSVIFEILDQMLALGADCNLADNEGNTPLYLASRMGLGTIVEGMMKQPGTNPLLANKITGLTPAAVAQIKWVSEQVFLVKRD